MALSRTRDQYACIQTIGKTEEPTKGSRFERWIELINTSIDRTSTTSHRFSRDFPTLWAKTTVLRPGPRLQQKHSQRAYILNKHSNRLSGTRKHGVMLERHLWAIVIALNCLGLGFSSIISMCVEMGIKMVLNIRQLLFSYLRPFQSEDGQKCKKCKK